MEEVRKYRKIERCGKRGTETVLDGSFIVVQEKLDGANASFEKIDGKLVCYSRNKQLDEHETLRGFYNWVQENVDADRVVEGYRYFGEWLVKHKIDYGENANDFYLFDVRSEANPHYVGQVGVEAAALSLGLKLAPVLYRGTPLTFEEIKEKFVGKSMLAPDGVGEGVVIKNFNGIYAKIVTEAFAEIVPQKLAKDPKEIGKEVAFVRTYLAPARVEKMLHKLVDEGIIEEGFGLSDMGTILKELSPRVLADLLEEEGRELGEDYDEKTLRKSIGKVLPSIAKALIA